MANPSTREEHIDYCLRALGAPVIEINLDDDQISDRVDESVQWFRDHHPDGSLRTYYKYQLSENDIFNGFIEGQFRWQYVVRIFPMNTVLATKNFFDIKYQMMLNDITDLQNFSGDIAYYEQMQQYLSLLDQKLSNVPDLIYDREQQRIYLEYAEGTIKAGDYVIFEIYIGREFVDGQPNVNVPQGAYNSMWNHYFMKDYTTCLLKKQWGQNLLKFDGMQLPGGVTINGRQLYEDALADHERLMTKFREEQDVGPIFFVG